MSIHRPASSFSISRHTNRLRARSVSPAAHAQKSKSILKSTFDRLTFKTDKINLDLIPQSKPSANFELGLQLKLIKKQYNYTKTEFSTIERAMSSAKSQLEKFENSQKHSDSRFSILTYRKHYLKATLAKTKLKLLNSLDNHDTYKHIKERMRLTHIFLEVKLNDFKDQLRLTQEIFREEETIKLKVYRRIGKKKKVFKDFSLDCQDTAKQKEILDQQLARDVKIKDKNSNRRGEMLRRREDIVEFVSNEERTLRNNFLRREVLLLKMWYSFLDRKLMRETEKFSLIEIAYSNIKSLTGLSNINDVVQKILTRESNYTYLMEMINESKAVCDRYKMKNLQIERNLTSMIVDGTSHKEENIEKLKASLLRVLKNMKNVSEKLQDVKKSSNFIDSWGRNKLKKLGVTDFEEIDDLKSLFSTLKTAVKGRVQEYKAIMKSKSEDQSHLLAMHDIKSISIASSTSNVNPEARTPKTQLKKRPTRGHQTIKS